MIVLEPMMQVDAGLIELLLAVIAGVSGGFATYFAVKYQLKDNAKALLEHDLQITENKKNIDTLTKEQQKFLTEKEIRDLIAEAQSQRESLLQKQFESLEEKIDNLSDDFREAQGKEPRARRARRK